MGDYIRKEGSANQDPLFKNQLVIPLGGLQYGQSRDVCLKYGPFKQEGKAPLIEAELQCRPLNKTSGNYLASCSVLDSPNLLPEEIDFHRNRAMVCSFISSLAPISNTTHQRTRASGVESMGDALQSLISTIRAMVLDDDANIGLLEDLEGQITLAVSKDYLTGWGFHYLLSMYNAHFKQVCNSFKDPGPQHYGKDSPLFTEAKKQLSYLFDTLPPPTPFVTVTDSHGQTRKVKTEMSRYNDSSNPCFAAACAVTLADGTKVEATALRKDMKLWTPKGERKLVGILETTVADELMCKIGELVITPWHPIFLNGKWVFPGQAAESTTLYTGTIYSLLLEQDRDPEAHGVEVGGHLSVTLGHGITHAADDGENVRVHAFFGDYDKVLGSLQSLPVDDGIYTSADVERDATTSLGCGFLAKN